MSRDEPPQVEWSLARIADSLERIADQLEMSALAREGTDATPEVSR